MVDSLFFPPPPPSLSLSLALSVMPLVSDGETRERRETPRKVSIPRLITLADPIVQR